MTSRRVGTLRIRTRIRARAAAIANGPPQANISTHRLHNTSAIFPPLPLLPLPPLSPPLPPLPLSFPLFVELKIFAPSTPIIENLPRNSTASPRLEIMVKSPNSGQDPQFGTAPSPHTGNFPPRPPKVSGGGGTCSGDCDASSAPSSAQPRHALVPLARSAWGGVIKIRKNP